MLSTSEAPILSASPTFVPPGPEDPAEKEWQAVRASRDPVALIAFWERNRETPQAREARAFAARIEFEDLRNSEESTALRAFERKYAGEEPASRASILAAQLEARVSAAAQIASLLLAYSRAFGGKDILQLASLRKMTPEVRRRILETFAQHSRIAMQVIPLRSPDFGQRVSADPMPDRAVVSAAVRIALRANNGDVPEPLRATVLIGVTRTGGTWKISSWE